jgi:hypothetical protein
VKAVCGEPCQRAQTKRVLLKKGSYLLPTSLRTGPVSIPVETSLEVCEADTQAAGNLCPAFVAVVAVNLCRLQQSLHSLYKALHKRGVCHPASSALPTSFGGWKEKVFACYGGPSTRGELHHVVASPLGKPLKNIEVKLCFSAVLA